LEISGLRPGEALDPCRPHPASWVGRLAAQFDHPSQDLLRSDTVELARDCGEKKEGLVTIERSGSTFPRASALLRIVVSPAVWKIAAICRSATHHIRRARACLQVGGMLSWFDLRT
jgi:hypothetical protein